VIFTAMSSEDRLKISLLLVKDSILLSQQNWLIKCFAESKSSTSKVTFSPAELNNSCTQKE